MPKAPDNARTPSEDQDLVAWDLKQDWSHLWTLDPEVTFLNHGSFGACPRPVLEAQERWRAEMERQPLAFLWRRYEERLDAARAELAAFLGADPRDLVFVRNVTMGLNAVLGSLAFRPGDELLTTDHEYNASRNILDFVASRAGAVVAVARVPFPLQSPAQVTQAVMDRVNARTRLVLLDHVTSLSGLIFPLDQLARELASRRIDLVVDGAHAPGMIPLNLRDLDVPFYAGNCHKWLCAPKGAGFLYVRRDRQPEIRPTSVSHGANSQRQDRSRFWLEFDWLGTDDPTPWLCLPDCIRMLGTLLPGGWPQLMARNRSLTLAARRILCDALAIPLPCPDEMIGTLATLPLPDAPAGSSPAFADHDSLEDVLDERYSIIVPVRYWPAWPQRILRIAAHAYNQLGQYRDLASVLGEIL
jgi:isopenicillin-N epimerase